MIRPTPAQIAAFDQTEAAANQQIDGEIAWMREALDEHGDGGGTLGVALYLIEHGTQDSLAMAYAWALRRIVEMQDGAR